jgi:predicted CXXCH cytochrome family protein
MRRMSIVLITCGLLMFGFAIGLASALPVEARSLTQDAPDSAAPTPLPTPPGPPDVQCRGCHDGMTRLHTFPSGETMPLAVDLAALDASPHSSLVISEPVACTGCHQNETGYRYPHTETLAQSVREHTVGVSQNCQSCHYPHLPFHDLEAVTAAGKQDDLPICADCHGNHNIARVAEIATVMPANCVACHQDKSTEWAADFVATRSGWGVGAEGYVGSGRCNGCHDDKYRTWRDTLHAKVIQDPHADPVAVVGDFNLLDEDRNFDLADVSYTIGGRWRQLYITQTVSNTFNILPAQWIVEAEEWHAYHPDDWQALDWRQECGSCHVTGLNTATWGFTEFGVGCESCHGPGGAHADDPENVKPFAEVDAQVCGACHSRGVSPEGRPFPATFRPGDALTDHFTFTVSAETVWADGSAKMNHQQYMDWSLGSPMSIAPDISCTTCHAVHNAGAAEGQLRAPLNDLCLECHTEQKALIKHIPYHEAAIDKHQFVCSDCHMPKTATSATPNDLHTHSFLQPNPQGSIDHGGVEAMPNSCNLCHTDPDEGPQWAAQTIAYAKETANIAPVPVFGPGPTPTSPPPPTPVASVGQLPVIDNVEASDWLRTAVWWVIGVTSAIVVVLVIGLIALYRRRKHD